MIDQDRHARLADFGLLTIVSDSTNPTFSNSSTNAGTIRWMSPELLDPDRFGFEDSRPTNESDCYALGMVILEVLTGQAPFTNYKDFIVIRKVVEGERPGRPQGPEVAWFTDDLWETLEQCWSPQPKVRPTLEAVLECLEQGSAAWEPLPPSEDGGNQAESDDESISTVIYHPRMFIRFALNFALTYKRPLAGQPILQDDERSPVLSCNNPRGADAGQILQPPESVPEPSSMSTPPAHTDDNENENDNDNNDDDSDSDSDSDDNDAARMATQPSIPNTDSNPREAGHSGSSHPPMKNNTMANTSTFYGDRNAGPSPRRQIDGVLYLQAIPGTGNTSTPATQESQGQGQFLAPAWARGRTPQPRREAGPSSLRGFGKQPLVETMPPTPGDMPVAGWASNPTLPRHPNGHGNGSSGGSTGAAFFRTYRDHDNSTTPRYHIMEPELNFAEIGHGRGTNHGMDILRWYDVDAIGDGGTDDEDLVVVDGDTHTPLTPPSGYGSANMVTPIPRRGYTVGDTSQSDGSNPYRHQPRPRARGVDHGTGSSIPPQIRNLQESVHQALGIGMVPPDNLSDSSNNSTGGRGRSERKGWRNRLTAAENYASSLLFGRGGNGAGGSVSGAGSSGQVLQEGDD